MTNTWHQTILESKASIYKKWTSPKRGNRQKWFCLFVFLAASKRLETNTEVKQKLWLIWTTFISILLKVLHTVVFGAHLVCFFLSPQQRKLTKDFTPPAPFTTAMKCKHRGLHIPSVVMSEANYTALYYTEECKYTHCT